MKKIKFPSYNLKVNFKINQKHSPKISNKSFSSKGPSPSILLPNQYQIFFYVQKKFWRHQHKKKNWIFLSAVYSSLHPLIPHVAYGGRYWLNLPLKRERERKILTYFFNFTFQQFPCAANANHIMNRWKSLLLLPVW